MTMRSRWPIGHGYYTLADQADAMSDSPDRQVPYLIVT